jgi:glutathione synthase/RimK-type ligase-like ATP-grasp enzyme
MTTVGIFGRRVDPQVGALADALPGVGGRAVVVDFHPFPRWNLATAGERQLFDDARSFETHDLGKLDVVHLRTTCFADLDPTDELPADAPEVGQYYRGQIAKVSYQIDLLEQLAQRVPVINPPASFRYHRLKALQHQRLLARGIPTPSAVITADPERARTFVEELEGRAVAKPLASGAEVVMADAAFFDAWETRAARRPFIFQQFVKGRALRAYLLGGQLVSMGEIHYDQRYVDWRERTQSVSPYEPSAELLGWMRDAVRLLDLPYCGIDIELDAHTKRFYLLDFNPSALFVGWSRLAGLDMAARIAEYLVAVARRGGEPWSEEPLRRERRS